MGFITSVINHIHMYVRVCLCNFDIAKIFYAMFNSKIIQKHTHTHKSCAHVTHTKRERARKRETTAKTRPVRGMRIEGR